MKPLIISLLALAMASFVHAEEGQGSAEQAAGPVLTKRSSDPLVNTLIQNRSPLDVEQQKAIEVYLTSEAKLLAPKTPTGATTTDPETVIDLSDGAKTKTITLQLGYLTSLMVVGENGATWPIRRARAGDDAVAKVDLVPDTGTLEISPQQAWVGSNLMLYLADRSQPIKLYLQVSADPADGVRDQVKLIVSGVPSGSSPLLQPNRVAIDNQLMNALGRSPGRNWTSVQVANDDNLPFSVNYWMSPDRKDAIVRLRGGSLMGPDWETETRDPDGGTRVYRFRGAVPLMLRVADSAGVEYQVSLLNPADILAGRDGSKRMTVKRTSPERAPIESPLAFEEPVGMVRGDRTQKISPKASQPNETVRTYESFSGKGITRNRVEIVSDLSINKDAAARLIEESYRNRPLPNTADLQEPPAAASAGLAVAMAAPAASAPPITGTATPGPAAASKATGVLTSATAAPAAVAAAPVAAKPAPAPVQTGYSYAVKSGGLYENLYQLTEKVNWKAPLWDLGDEDHVVSGGYTVSGDTPEEVIAKYLEPYAEAYKFNVKISPLERKVWLH